MLPSTPNNRPRNKVLAANLQTSVSTSTTGRTTTTTTAPTMWIVRRAPERLSGAASMSSGWLTRPRSTLPAQNATPVRHRGPEVFGKFVRQAHLDGASKPTLGCPRLTVAATSPLPPNASGRWALRRRVEVSVNFNHRLKCVATYTRNL